MATSYCLLSEGSRSERFWCDIYSDARISGSVRRYLLDALEQAGFRVQVVGDAVEPRHMQAAVYEGAEAARIV
jgi:hypothetical protein